MSDANKEKGYPTLAECLSAHTEEVLEEMEDFIREDNPEDDFPPGEFPDRAENRPLIKSVDEDFGVGDSVATVLYPESHEVRLLIYGCSKMRRRNSEGEFASEPAFYMSNLSHIAIGNHLAAELIVQAVNEAFPFEGD